MSLRSVEKTAWKPLIVSVLILGCALNWSGTLGVLRDLIEALRPVITGFVFALVLLAPLNGCEKLIKRITRGKCSKNLRDTISLVLVVLLVLLVVFVSVTVLLPQAGRLMETLINILQNHQKILANLRESIGIADVTFDAQWEQWMSELLTRVAVELQNVLLNVITATTSLFTVILSATLAFYLLAARRQVRRGFDKLVDVLLQPRKAALVKHTASLSVNTVSVWFAHQCLEGAIEGVALFVLMTVFGLPNALPQAVITAVTYLIPYVGAWIAFGVGFITMLSVNLHSAIVFGIILIVLQTLDGNLLNPHLVGGSVGLPPWLSLSAVCFLGSLLGIEGMFLAVPICAVCYVLVKDWIHTRTLEKAQQEAEEKKAETAQEPPENTQ